MTKINKRWRLHLQSAFCYAIMQLLNFYKKIVVCEFATVYEFRNYLFIKRVRERAV